MDAVHIALVVDLKGRKRDTFREMIKVAKSWRSQKFQNLVFHFDLIELSAFNCKAQSEDQSKGEENIGSTGSIQPNLREYDMVLHKNLADMGTFLSKNKNIDNDCETRLQMFGEILSKSKIHIDYLRGVWLLLDRLQMTKVIDRAIGSMRSKFAGEKWNVSAPRWAWVSESDESQKFGPLIENLRFPVIMKTRLATSTDDSHKMVIAYDMNGVISALEHVFDNPPRQGNTLEPGNSSSRHEKNSVIGKIDPIDFPPEMDDEGPLDDGVLVQEFSQNHGAVLFKIFVVGDRVSIQTRRSIDFGQGCHLKHGYYFFNSQLVGCKESVSVSNGYDRTRKCSAIYPESEMVRKIATSVRAELKLDLLGIDLIYDIEQQCFFVIDVNYCPGYRGVPNISQWLLEFIAEKCVEHDLLQ